MIVPEKRSDQMSMDNTICTCNPTFTEVTVYMLIFLKLAEIRRKPAAELPQENVAQHGRSRSSIPG